MAEEKKSNNWIWALFWVVVFGAFFVLKPGGSSQSPAQYQQQTRMQALRELELQVAVAEKAANMALANDPNCLRTDTQQICMYWYEMRNRLANGQY